MNLYLDAAKFITAKSPKPRHELVDRSFLTSSIKQATLNSEPKRILALLLSAARYKPILDLVIQNSGILKAEKKLTYAVTILLVHDLLISKTGITAGKGPIKDSILRHKTRLKAELTKAKIKLNVSDIRTYNIDVSVAESGTDRRVRWVRLNALNKTDSVSSRDQKQVSLTELLGFTSTERFPPAENTIYKDVYIPDLYAINNKHTARLTALSEYKQGKLIIQDRASCFPAYILRPSAKDVVIDACAAPGNKTTHLCALMAEGGSQQGKVIAFERDPQRFKVLQKMTQNASASVAILNRDFTLPFTASQAIAKLGVKPDEVTKILVDPSCSGSGIFRRDDTVSAPNENEPEQEQQRESQEDRNRLLKLSIFQTEIVKHALTAYPKVERVVYSTCSIHAQENEVVVRNLLDDDKVQKLGWTVMERRDVIPSWPRRGLKQYFDGLEKSFDIAEGCIRAEPNVDGGIGFFVVGFERCLSATDGDGTPRDSVTVALDGGQDEYHDEEYEEWNGFENADT